MIATVYNNLEMDVNITLRVLLDNGLYVVDNGQIVLQRNNEKYSELYIQSNIQALSDEDIIINEI